MQGWHGAWHATGWRLLRHAVASPSSLFYAWIPAMPARGRLHHLWAGGCCVTLWPPLISLHVLIPAVPARGRLHHLRAGGVHAAAPCGRHERGQACQRGDGRGAWQGGEAHCWLQVVWHRVLPRQVPSGAQPAGAGLMAAPVQSQGTSAPRFELNPTVWLTCSQLPIRAGYAIPLHDFTSGDPPLISFHPAA